MSGKSNQESGGSPFPIWYPDDGELKKGGSDRETGRGEVGTRESGTRMLMLAYRGRQGGGGGGRRCV